MAGPESLDGSSPPPPAPVTGKKYGVTKPISVAGPTEVDFQRNTDLEKVGFFFFNLKFNWELRKIVNWRRI